MVLRERAPIGLGSRMGTVPSGGVKMTPKAGDRIVAHGLPVRPKGSKLTLPPTIAVVLSVDRLRVVIKLRSGGGAPVRFAPKPRQCDPAQVVRLATTREVWLGLAENT